MLQGGLLSGGPLYAAHSHHPPLHCHHHVHRHPVRLHLSHEADGGRPGQRGRESSLMFDVFLLFLGAGDGQVCEGQQ